MASWPRWSAVLGIALVAALSCATGEAADKAATPAVMQQGASQLLRLGLEKSAILRLPAAAKDVIVGNTSLVDVVLKNRTTAYLFARKAGQTNVFFLDANGRQLLQLDLEVTLDLKGLKALLDRSLPGSAIQVDSTGNNIVLKGTVSDVQQGRTAEELSQRFLSTYGGDATSIVNLLKVAEGNQVMLKVRVVELKRSILKRLGIDLDGKISAGAFKLGFGNTTFPVNLPPTFTGDAVFGGSPLSMNATIKALEQSGLATVLAEPTLTAISGAPASFFAGGQYPFTSCDAPNVNNLYNCTIDYQDYGIKLNFTPTVLSEGRIALNIFTEVSELGDPLFGNNNPIVDTRNAQTSIELPSGGSMMLAGLIKNVSGTKLQSTPGLRKLPILGALFSSQEFQRKESELVVIVTPYVVGPTDPDNLATPIDRFNSATDLQQLFLGRLNKVYGLPGSASAQGTYNGQVGHIIE